LAVLERSETSMQTILYWIPIIWSGVCVAMVLYQFGWGAGYQKRLDEEQQVEREVAELDRMFNRY
jgi:hypothetical protein